MNRRIMESFLRRIRTRATDDNDDDEDDPTRIVRYVVVPESNMNTGENATAAAAVPPTNEAALQRLWLEYRERRRERQQHQREHFLERNILNQRHNDDEEYYLRLPSQRQHGLQHQLAHQSLLRHFPHLHPQHTFDRRVRRRRRRTPITNSPQHQHSRRRVQQIVWQYGQQIDAALMNLVEALSDFNFSLFFLLSFVIVFIYLQTKHVFYYRGQWFLVCDFFSNSGITDHSAVEQFTDQFGCYTLISCINAIVVYAALPLISKHQQPLLPDSLGHEASLEYLNDLQFNDNRRIFEQNYHSQRLILKAIHRKEQFVLNYVYDDNNVPLQLQKQLASSLNIANLNDFARIFESLKQSSASFHANIVLQNLQSIEKQLLTDLYHWYETFIRKHCSQIVVFEEQVDCASNHIWQKILYEDRKHIWTIGSLLFWTMISLGVGALWRYSEELIEWISNVGDLFRRDSISSGQSFVEFNFTSPTVVENTLNFRIFFFKRNKEPHEVTDADDVVIDVTNPNRVIRTTIERSVNNNTNEWSVWFPARASGDYYIQVLVNGKHAKNSPFFLQLKAAPPSPSNVRVLNYSSSILTTPKAQTNLLEIELRDKYDNLCESENNYDTYLSEFTFDVHDIATRTKVHPQFVWESVPLKPANFSLFWTLPNFGMFQAEVFYQGMPIICGRFQILSMKGEEITALDMYSAQTQNQKIHTFEAKLLPTYFSRTNSSQSSMISKTKSVTCYLSSKQIVIQEYLFKIFPKRVATIRVCPSTKLYFARDYIQGVQQVPTPTPSSSSSSSPIHLSTSLPDIRKEQATRCPDKNQFVIIDDGSQNPYELLIPNRNLFVITFTNLLLRKIGGSETYQDKENYFFQELAKIHGERPFREVLGLALNRERVVEETMTATYRLNEAGWRHPFEISFENEQGLDYGGLRKEWLEILCKELFEPKDEKEKSLFCCLNNSKQGFVHPNARCTLPLSYYEFAGQIVGKSLVDTALGTGTKYLINARFTRSFLLQLIGLGVNYQHFETDDPELYISKVQFLLQNDVENLDLYFSEDEYDSDGRLIRTIDLIPKGHKIKVTDQNKHDYLARLAQHRLCNSVSDKIQAFLKGLSFLIPNQLLSIFDANELELLICGAETYSLSDLRQHHQFEYRGGSDEERILSWFWRSLSSFSDQEMARLLQFTTGSSRLPPRGFSELSPPFTITISPSYCYGKLPNAHTCFNQICLPDQESFEKFDQSLRTAITEGNLGFGLS